MRRTGTATSTCTTTSYDRARAFDGCIHLSISPDPMDAGRINNAEVWHDATALDAWRAQADAPAWT